MEKSTPIGLVLGIALVVGTILMGSSWTTFLDLHAFLIVVGGTVAALFVGYPFRALRAVPRQVRALLAYRAPDLHAHIRQFVGLARLVRHDGLLELDRRLGQVKSDVTRFGLEMAVDGLQEAEVDALLTTRMDEALSERRGFVRLFHSAAAYAPAFGMVGTLMGLIQMLQRISDPDAIGPAMAVALIATFYGALLANLVFLPLAGKQKEQVAELAREQDLIHAGVLGILRGESPSQLEKRLVQFLEKPDARVVKRAPVTPLSRAA